MKSNVGEPTAGRSSPAVPGYIKQLFYKKCLRWRPTCQASHPATMLYNHHALTRYTSLHSPCKTIIFIPMAGAVICAGHA